ncbi:ribonucleotide-diphosphate reductase subunit alpha [Desulfobacter hydrogenophilus]|uniref:Vitamin B12-dependent ribonucleotide reductase n=1 Tax=Desulfobacter hydrogenophilus TaxID=2291 RepID=A0A328F9J6_9BACT|nr:vitamin B12-dependent ribonucleotide reductase [Desulfobacter hydrogenophilus]NDY72895.1 vitamin B12-dependent ribonucleotide reductase [Desulfobacter hydrogenophilus]QBH11810.1 vitamin B12-dependent ribonucleotide reductase [Desulfobacter hydrogenophilus]RAM01039.1 ribonucleotide-diphosphate reductase subunit alpha [Desulfobacter hydrogenophilus]
MGDGEKVTDQIDFLTENARTVLERRYLKKDASGKVCESPEHMFRRVAAHIAKAEKNYDKNADIQKIEDQFYRLMAEFRFLPNSPTLMNAGRSLGQLAACFVLPVDDSIDGIFEAVKNAAIIHKSGGGTGFSFSRLRPEKSKVGSTGGVASGPVSFMKIFNTATEQIKQGGTRRGANMAVLRVDHPDIMTFIRCKSNKSELNNFNISVGVTDQFMDAVSQKGDYDLIDPSSGKMAGRLSAEAVYDELVKQAWETGDPGIIFLDEINRFNTLPDIGEMEATNPCGEQPLLPMEACNLGSINLTRFITQKESKSELDYEKLKETIHLAVRFLDNTIDMSRYPIDEIDKTVKANRKIGLGIMGFADLLYMLEIPYDSDEALELAGNIMAFVQKESHKASSDLAKERGSFPNFDRSIFKDNKDPRRNATTTTIAPTGTLSIIAGCSSGIEPAFALSYVRTVMDNDRLIEVNPVFKRFAIEKGFYSDALMEEIAENGTVKENLNVPSDLRSVFVTAHDIKPEYHIKMQAAFQKYTDNAVSKTVNLPHDASPADVRFIYDQAFETKCKGVTIYRDGSKDNQVLSVSKKEEIPVEDEFLLAGQKRPQILEGFTESIKTGMGSLYITVSEFKGRPFELFATVGKSGKSTQAKTEAIGRLISLALRSGIGVDEIIAQISGIRGEHAVFQDRGLIYSIPDAIAKVLEKRYLPKGNGNGKKQYKNSLKSDLCPECGQPITFEEGCKTCHSCGYTRCG